MDKALFLLVLQRLPDTGAATLLKLYEYFGSIAAIQQAPHQKLASIIQGDALIQLELFRDKGEHSKPGVQAAIDYEWIIKNNISILCIDSDDYPQQLREIHCAPPVLMVAGDLGLLHKKQLAIIGSRKASPSGLEHAYSFASELVENGFVITSGLALGVDAAAHRGALSASLIHEKNKINSGCTIAVIATGVDIIYPAYHKKISQEICEFGAIVSEFPLGTMPRKENFPRRNRIISGLSCGVLVVEAEEKSGSLITARYAIEQNREVFAIPGSIKNAGSRGCHQLIRDGAKLVESVSDILSELEHPFGQIVLFNNRKPVDDKNETMSRDEISAEEKTFLSSMDDIAADIDQLVHRTSLPVERVTSLLLMLEIKGWVEVSAEGWRRI